MRQIVQTGRFSGEIVSTGRDSLSWTAGQLDVGAGLRYLIDAGSQTDLALDTEYYLYFDLDTPSANPQLKISNNYTDSLGLRRVLVAWVHTGTANDAHLMIIRADGRPQLSGNTLVTGVVNASLARIRSPGAGSGVSGVYLDGRGIRGYERGGVERFRLSNDGSGFLGKSNGITWDSGGNLGISSSVTIGGSAASSIRDGANKANAGLNSSGQVKKGVSSDNISETLGAGASRVMIDSSGIRGYNASSVKSFEVKTDGSGSLGAGANKISWNNAGRLSVPGGIITSGIQAGNITNGTLTAGNSQNSIKLLWSDGGLEMFRAGSKVLDLGDIGANLYGKYGIYTDHADAAVAIRRYGARTKAYNNRSIAFFVTTQRGADGVASEEEIGYYATIGVSVAGNTTNTTGFDVFSAATGGDAHGFRVNLSSSTHGDAYGLKILSVNALLSTKTAYGIHINIGEKRNQYAIRVVGSSEIRSDGKIRGASLESDGAFSAKGGRLRVNSDGSGSIGASNQITWDAAGAVSLPGNPPTRAQFDALVARVDALEP